MFLVLDLLREQKKLTPELEDLKRKLEDYRIYIMGGNYHTVILREERYPDY